MSERIESAAQAICGYENDMDWDIPWSIEGEEGRKAYREMATTAIDAYRTLTDDQWEAQREKVARALCLANDANPDHIVFSFEHGRGVHEWYTFAIDAGAAMLALGFVRTLDSQP